MRVKTALTPFENSAQKVSCSKTRYPCIDRVHKLIFRSHYSRRLEGWSRAELPDAEQPRLCGCCLRKAAGSSGKSRPRSGHRAKLFHKSAGRCRSCGCHCSTYSLDTHASWEEPRRPAHSRLHAACLQPHHQAFDPALAESWGAKGAAHKPALMF